MAQSVLVIGAGGRLGSEALGQLVERGLDVEAAYRTDRDGLSDRIAAAGATPVQADLADKRAMRKLLQATDAAIFTASLTASVRAAKLIAPGQPAVFLSSNNVGLDTEAKHYRDMARAEKEVHQAAPHATILRPTLIYGGADDNNLRRMMQTIRRWPVVPRPASDARQQPVYHRDLAKVAARAVAEPGWAGRTVAVGGPDIVTQGELVQALVDALGARRLVIPIPIPLAIVGAQAAIRLGLARPAVLRQLRRAQKDKTARGPDIVTTDTPLTQGLAELAATLAPPP